MNAADNIAIIPQGNFVLNEALKPILHLLQNDKIVEISVNKPRQVFIEELGKPHMEYVEIPDLTEQAILHIGQRVATATKQSINEQTPILSASIDHFKARIQVVLPPAAPEGGAISVRRQVLNDFSLEQYNELGAFDAVKLAGEEEDIIDTKLRDLLKKADYYSFIKTAISNRKTIMISGGTSSGKTTFLNACLKSVDDNERVITIEDTRELLPPQKNALHLVASKGGQGTANVSVQDLLESTLRMRPDRLFVGEIRGSEAFTFLQAINTGHPGSMSTVHANNPQMAYERLAMMMMQSGLTNGFAKSDLLDYIKMVIPIVVQVKNINGKRGVSEISFSRG